MVIVSWKEHAVQHVQKWIVLSALDAAYFGLQRPVLTTRLRLSAIHIIMIIVANDANDSGNHGTMW